MEQLDPNLEAQVWRRIAGQSQPERGDLRPLLLMAWEQASVLRHLTGLVSGRSWTGMKGLGEKALGSVEAIKGILTMSGQPVGKLRAQPIPKEPARRLLEKSYHRAGRLMTEYTARAMDPEFGVVWQVLADRERENSARILEILGMDPTV